MENYKILSNRLRELRHKLGMTQNQFCEKIGFTQATLSAYETMSKSPSLDILLEIAKKCNVSIDWLLGLTDSVNDEMKSISDVIQILIKLSKEFDIDIIDAEVEVEEIDNVAGYPDIFKKDVSVIYFPDNLIQSFLVEWKKMKMLYENNELDSIDDDVYNLWIEKCISKYKKESLFKLNDSDLPF